MRYYVTLLCAGASERAIDVVTRADGSVEVRVGDEIIPVDVAQAGAALSVRVGDRVVDLWLDDDELARASCAGNGSRDAMLNYVASGMRARATVETERSRIAAAGSRRGGGRGGQVRAPMPGRVVKILVTEGEAVAAGAPLAVVEAMKMENELCADSAGVVRAIHTCAGRTVEGGATLIELAPLPAAAR